MKRNAELSTFPYLLVGLDFRPHGKMDENDFFLSVPPL